MKRHFRAFAVAFLLFTVHQLSVAQSVQIGLRGGVNWGMVSTPASLAGLTANLKASPGPTGALFLDIPISDRLSFRPEIAYVQKGFMIQEGVNLNLGFFNLPVGARVAYQTQAVEIPLLAKVNLTDGPVQLYLLAGPAVSYAVDGRIRTRATAFFTSRPMDVALNYGSTLNRWDIGGVVGAGLALNAGTGKFFGEVRYEQGFTRQVQVPVANVNVRNRGVAVSFGYSFPIN